MILLSNNYSIFWSAVFINLLFRQYSDFFSIQWLLIMEIFLKTRNKNFMNTFGKMLITKLLLSFFFHISKNFNLTCMDALKNLFIIMWKSLMKYLSRSNSSSRFYWIGCCSFIFHRYLLFLWFLCSFLRFLIFLLLFFCSYSFFLFSLPFFFFLFFCFFFFLTLFLFFLFLLFFFLLSFFLFLLILILFFIWSLLIFCTLIFICFFTIRFPWCLFRVLLRIFH